MLAGMALSGLVLGLLLWVICAGICVLSSEGLSLEAFRAADILAPDIRTALDLVEKPMRIVATLRK